MEFHRCHAGSHRSRWPSVLIKMACWLSPQSRKAPARRSRSVLRTTVEDFQRKKYRDSFRRLKRPRKKTGSSGRSQRSRTVSMHSYTTSEAVSTPRKMAISLQKSPRTTGTHLQRPRTPPRTGWRTLRMPPSNSGANSSRSCKKQFPQSCRNTRDHTAGAAATVTMMTTTTSKTSFEQWLYFLI